MHPLLPACLLACAMLAGCEAKPDMPVLFDGPVHLAADDTHTFDLELQPGDRLEWSYSARYDVVVTVHANNEDDGMRSVWSDTGVEDEGSLTAHEVEFVALRFRNDSSIPRDVDVVIRSDGDWSPTA